VACRRGVAKLGGSVITVKDSPETVNWDSIDALASQVAEYVGRGGRVALVLGGGSFGHYTVSRILSSKGLLEAVDAPAIQMSMLKLGMAFLHKAVQLGVPATLHPPHTYCGEGACNYEPISRDLGAGLTPVTYGDALIVGGRVDIVSGDKLAVDIARSIRADCLFYVVDTGGVLDESGSVMREVRGATDMPGSGRARGWDVTGGMEGKIARAMEAPRDTVVRIIGVSDLLRALNGESVGTLVSARRGAGQHISD
jgi:isopentenyl phosphate kinase